MLESFTSRLLQGAKSLVGIAEPPVDLAWDLAPEDKCVVNVTDASVICSRTDGKREAVSWPDLDRVEIEATDGTWGRTVLWLLSDGSRTCHVPHGSIGEMSLMASLQALPDWDNGAILAALRSSGDFRYECWRRGSGGAGGYRARWQRPETPASLRRHREGPNAPATNLPS